MNELIRVENGVANLSGKTIADIIALEDGLKKLKAKEDELKQAILSEMEAKNIIKIDTPELTINYIAPTDRETFDKKKLKEDLPSLYDEYVKFTPVKSSVRVKIK